ncbi:MAG: tetratricopeptide repeat protein [candidate division WOR-3 bacterium]
MGTEDLLEEAKFELLAGRYDKAEKFLREVLSDEPNNTDALFNLGVLYEITHQNSKALECFNRVLEIDPKHKEARERAERLSEI